MVMSNPIDQTAAGGGISALIARVHRGDQAAARELMAGARPIVARIARAHRPNRTTEDDLVQEVFLKVFTRLGQYRGDAPFEHWISRIAVTTCMDQLRAQRCRPELRMADLSESEALLLETRHCDPRELPPGQLLATHELLHHLLNRLRPDDRRVVVWFELEGKTIAEIEKLTGWNFNFVKMRLFRARRKLKRCFAHLPGFDGATHRRSTVLRWPRDVRSLPAHTKSVSRRRGNREHSRVRALPLGPGEPTATELVFPLTVEVTSQVA